MSDRYIEKALLYFAVASLLLHLAGFAVLKRNNDVELATEVANVRNPVR